MIGKTDTARFDHQVGVHGLSDRGTKACIGSWIYHHFAPIRWRNVAILLAIEYVGLVEADLMTKHGQGLQQATIISRRTIPV